MIIADEYIDSDDEEEEDEEGEAEAAPADQAGSSEARVKQEPDAEPPVKKASKSHQQSNELQVYSVEELARFRPRNLLADSEYLDGEPEIVSTPTGFELTSRDRETEECKA